MVFLEQGRVPGDEGGGCQAQPRPGAAGGEGLGGLGGGLSLCDLRGLVS